jgi:hypothetical protein
MRRRKLPYMIRLIRLAAKSVWYALTIPNDPYHPKEVNFWNMPVKKEKDNTGNHPAHI